MKQSIHDYETGFDLRAPKCVQATVMTVTNRRIDLLNLLQFHGNRSVSKRSAYKSSGIIPDVLALPTFTTLSTLDPYDSSSTDTQPNVLRTCCCNSAPIMAVFLSNFFHFCYLYSLILHFCHCINIYWNWLGE
jgi:hypothetical protein